MDNSSLIARESHRLCGEVRAGAAGHLRADAARDLRCVTPGRTAQLGLLEYESRGWVERSSRTRFLPCVRGFPPPKRGKYRNGSFWNHYVASVDSTQDFCTRYGIPPIWSDVLSQPPDYRRGLSQSGGITKYSAEVRQTLLTLPDEYATPDLIQIQDVRIPGSRRTFHLDFRKLLSSVSCTRAVSPRVGSGLLFLMDRGTGVIDVRCCAREAEEPIGRKLSSSSRC